MKTKRTLARKQQNLPNGSAASDRAYDRPRSTNPFQKACFKSWLFVGLMTLLSFSASRAQYDVAHYIPPYNWNWFTSAHVLYFNTSATVPATVTISKSDGSLIGTVTVNPNVVVSYTMPFSNNQTFNTANTVLNGQGLIITATQPVSVALKNWMGAAGAAGNAVAISQGQAMLGREFRVGYYRSGFAYGVSVIATENNTVISHNGTPVTTLNAGQSYIFSAGSVAIGARISSDKDISVLIAGRNDAPAGCGDQTLDFTVPVSAAGTEYVVVKANGNATLEQFTLVATQANTVVNVSGFAPVTLANAGSFATFSNGTTPGTFRYVTSDKPVMAYQGTGNSCEAGLNVLASTNCTGSTKILQQKFDATFNVGIIAPSGVPVTINNGATTLSFGSAVTVGGGKVLYYLSEANFSSYPYISISSTQNISAFFTERVGGYGACAFLSGFSQTPLISLSARDECDGTATLSVGNPGIFSGFQWSLGGSPIPGATNATYTATTSGAYSVEGQPLIPGCASVISDPSTLTLVNGSAGVLAANASTVCFFNGSANIGASHTSAVIPTDYELHYILVSGGIIRQIAATPSFTVGALGNYEIYAFVAETSNPSYPHYFNIGAVVPGTTSFSVITAAANSTCAYLSAPAAVTVSTTNCCTPSAVCRNITVALNAQGAASIAASSVDNGSTLCGGTLSINRSAFGCSDLGANSVVLTVTSGNTTSTCTATVTVVDPIGPSISCPANETLSNDPGLCGAVLTYSVTSSDNCPGAPVLQTQGLSSGSLFPVGTTTNSFIATDASGHTATCEFTVTVTDDEEPSLLCGEAILIGGPNNSFANDVTLTNDQGVCGAVYEFDNIAEDNCPGVTISQIDGLPSGSTYPVGSTTNTYLATDAAGNTTSCSFIVTVLDVEPPLALCQDVTAVLDANSFARVTPSDIENGSSDNCGIDTIYSDICNFFCQQVGENTVILTVVDENGNLSTCNSTVTILDQTPPTAVCQNITVQLDLNGSVAIEAPDVEGGSYDNCELDSISANPTTFGCSNVGNNSVVLIATDLSGNTSSCTATVTVVDAVPPTALCQNISVQLDAVGNASIVPANIDFGSNDACGIQNLSLNISSFSCANVGNNGVVLTVTDVNGNSSTCAAVVNVQDLVPPTAICRNVTISLDGNGQGCTTTAAVDNGSSDVCGIQSLSLNASCFTCANVGSNPVILTATDVNGNVSTCAATVTVQDLVPPTAVCRNITVALDNTGNVTATTTAVNNGSSDACGIQGLSLNPAAFSCTNLGANAVTLTVTDVNGNVSTCSATVNVVDLTPPSISCPANVTVSCVRDLPAPNAGLVTAHDNCTVISIVHVSDAATGTGCAGNPRIVTRTYRATDQSGNTATCTQTLTAQATPVIADASNNAIVIPAYADSACKTISVIASGGCAPYTYQWSNGPTTTSQSVCPTVSTTYYVTVTDAQGCRGVDSVRICVLDVLCTDRTNNGQTGNGQSGNGVNQSPNAIPHIAICHVPPGRPQNAMTQCLPVPAARQHILAGHGGDYLGGCGNLSTRRCIFGGSVKMADPAAATLDAHSSISLQVFPNPTNGNLSVQVSCTQCGDEGIYKLEVTDIYGKTFMKSDIHVTLGEGNQRIDLSRLAAGVYLVRVDNGGQRIVERVVKQ